jgi:hypothetical protein
VHVGADGGEVAHVAATRHGVVDRDGEGAVEREGGAEGGCVRAVYPLAFSREPRHDDNLCLYMYVCVYIYLYIYISIYLYLYLCVYLYIYISIYLYLYIYIYISIYIYIYIYVCTSLPADAVGGEHGHEDGQLVVIGTRHL